MLAENGTSINIDAVHSRAICDEIGYRLGELLRRGANPELPPRLKDLMAQLAKIDLDRAPSIAPSLDDMIVSRELIPHTNRLRLPCQRSR